MVRRRILGIAWILLVFFALTLIVSERLEAADSVTFRVIAINPSKTKSQKTEVKKYLPEEIRPKDVIDSGGLDIEYDTDKSLYYAYKESVELTPAEVRVFEIEVEDVWLVGEDELTDLRERTDSILLQLENSEYHLKAETIANTIYKRLEEIRTSQLDDSVSRQGHIGIFRNNLNTIEDIKEDIARMEKILVTAGGPPSPEMLADAKIKADSPSTTMTWIVIFVIIIFTGLLAGVLFFTWQHQARVTKEAILSSRKNAFPEFTAKEKKEEPGE